MVAVDLMSDSVSAVSFSGDEADGCFEVDVGARLKGRTLNSVLRKSGKHLSPDFKIICQQRTYKSITT